MQTKPTYIVVEPGVMGLDGEEGFIHEAFEADDDASAIAEALEMWEEVPFDLIRSDGPDKESVNVYGHRPAKPPPLN